MSRIDVVDIVNRNYDNRKQQCDLFDSDAKDVFSFLQDVESGEITPTSDELNALLMITSIDLSNSGITDISALSRLTNLQLVDLSFNQISDISPLSELTNLQTLYLNSNHIWDIPPLSKLTNLQNLNLSFNQISDISPLSELTNLQCLNLGRNQISDISPLSELTNIKSLNLEFNHITNMGSLSKLKKLVTLDLRHNQIIDISPLDSLTNLQKLSLSNNPIKELTDSFSKLKQLTHLDLSDLTINCIPKSLVDLKRPFLFSSVTNGFNLANTTLTEQDIKIFKRSHEEILEYYNADKVKIEDAKIVFLGNGGAGKTHTIMRLRNDGEKLSDDAKIDMTTKIDINTVSYKDRNINVWDFGGQDYMHHIHRLFLTPRTVYAVVLYNRHEKYNHIARYWLHNIATHASSNELSVFLLENCHDDTSEQELGITSLKREYGDIIQTPPIHYSAKCTPKEEFNKKLEPILHKTNEYKFELLATVAKVKEALSSNQNDCISYDDYIKVFHDNGITNDDDIQKALDTFNCLGCFFSAKGNDDELPKYLVLNPNWLFDYIYAIIDKTKKIFEDICFTINDGIVDINVIKKALGEKTEEIKKTLDEKTEVDYILELMHTFELAHIFENENNENKVFIPGLCKNDEPNDNDVRSNDGYIFEYKFSYLPDSVLFILMVRAHRSGFKVTSAWSRGVCIMIHEIKTVIKLDEENEKLLIKPLPENENTNTNCFQVFKWIDEQLKDDSDLQSIKRKLGGLEFTGYILAESQTHKTARFNVSYLLDACNKNIRTVTCSELDEHEEFIVDELLGKIYTEAEKQKLLEEIKRENSMNNGVTYNIEAINGPANFGDGPSTLIGGDQNIAGINMELNKVKGDQYRSVGDMTVNKNSGISDDTLNNILSAYATADAAAIEICNKLINNNLILANEFISKLFENLSQINDSNIQEVCQTLKDEPNAPGKIRTFFEKIKNFGKNNREEIWATIRTAIQVSPAILQILAK
ncbi:MAG: leucine-rich repeat domain-containing protein [Acutalibacteraceae bacterium]